MVKTSPPKPSLHSQNPGKWNLYRVESESEPGVYHVVAVRYEVYEVKYPQPIGLDLEFKPVEWVCSCKGFNYSKICWHIQELGFREDGD